jgi:hypothetical protein
VLRQRRAHHRRHGGRIIADVPYLQAHAADDVLRNDALGVDVEWSLWQRRTA